MNKLVALITTTIGSGLGWWLGAKAGIMTAFMLSMVGVGVGYWAARWLVSNYLE